MHRPAALALVAVLFLPVHANADYTNVDGNRIRSPAYARNGPPAGATARCRDGTYSFSQHHRGTCSGHHGVDEWLEQTERTRAPAPTHASRRQYREQRP